MGWEPIEGSQASQLKVKGSLYVRLEVPGGWLVRTSTVKGVALAFVPDESSEWDDPDKEWP